MNLTTKQAAALIGIDETNVRRHCRTGQLKATKFGRAWMIPREEIERFAKVPRRRGRKKKETKVKGQTSSDLFDLFVGHSTTVAEIAAMDENDIERQIHEMRQDEPDDLELTDAEIADGIYRFAVAETLSL